MVVVSTKTQMLLKKVLLVVLSLLVTKVSAKFRRLSSTSFKNHAWRYFKDDKTLTLLMMFHAEDTINVFDKINFEGPFTTITANVNISTPVITRSVIITGMYFTVTVIVRSSFASNNKSASYC